LNRGDAESAEKNLDPRLNELATRVIGAAIEVHRVLGPGYLESVYEEAMNIELQSAGVPFERQKPVALSYKGHDVGQARLDFLIGGELVLELKAADKLAPIHRAQLISYLKATGCQLGLVINFNERALRDGIMRLALSVRPR
jgi:GxxExxY protein